MSLCSVSCILANISAVEQITGQFGINWPSLLAQILNFCLLAFVLYRFAFKPILATLDQRREKIADGLQYAEEMKIKLADAQRHHAEALKQAAIEAQKILEDARHLAQIQSQKQIEQTVAHTEEMIKKAQKAIELERQNMFEQARLQMKHLVVETTAAVLARELSEHERTAFAESAIKELAR